MKNRILLSLLVLLLAGCNLPFTAGVVARAWIDAPLDGTRLDLHAPVTLSFHASDKAGVALLETSVDGVVLHTLENPNPGELLVYLTDAWQADTLGQHVIRVRTRNTAGTWGDPDQVTVYVQAATDTPTPSPTSSPTPTPTPSPTATPTGMSTLTSTPTAFAGFGVPLLSANGFYYGSGSCTPTQMKVAVQVGGSQTVDVLVFFFKLSDEASAKSGNWSEGQSMNPTGGGTYQVTLLGDVMGPTAGFARAHVMYQFVAQLNGGGILRSPVYSDLELAKCSGGLIQGFHVNPLFHGFVTVTPTEEQVK